MLISELYKAIGIEQKHSDIELKGITADSRAVGEGFLFVAVAGVSVDGHDFIPSALERGAAAVVCERIPASAAEHPEVEWTQVADSATALGFLASQWYGNPSKRMTLVGVTGTNGKTTIATLLYDMARLMGHKAGLLSTVANKIDGEVHPATHTTPDVLTINRLMSEMVAAGCDFCAMEVSSHACHQKRIAGLDFDGGIFTNLTRDHLDYHKTVANYLAAKKSFFDGLKAEAFALVNIDDKNGTVMLQNCKARHSTYALQRPADFHCRMVEDRLDGMLLDINGTEVETAFTGRFNAYNLTAVYGACILMGMDVDSHFNSSADEVLRCLSMLRPVAGRMQTFRSSDGITAIVDYAHTPDALANALGAIAETMNGRGRIITVAGAGGDRDHGKRPLMAAEAVKRSDMLIITSDNPRSENPAQIAADMLAGVPVEMRERVETVLDRGEAIAYALGMALPGDVVLVAGKGHEDYQIIGDKKTHFDDAEEVKKNLQ